MAFWTELLAYAKLRDTLHANISPSNYGWIGARKHGQWWNYVVLQDETRVELYLDEAEATMNKAAFDVLYQQRAAIEAVFGEQLFWQRLDDKRASRISFSVRTGGWVDHGTWPAAIQQTVVAMKRLYAAFVHPVEALKDA